MTSRKRQHSVEKDSRKTDYIIQSIKDFSEESVDDMLANVDQFIKGVYRDLSITPPQSSSAPKASTFPTMRSPISSASTSPDGASSLSGTLYGSNVASPTTRRNLDAEIERIDRICDNVNQNLQSIGLSMNHSNNNNTSSNVLNLNLPTSPSSSTSSLMTLNLNSPSLSSIIVNVNVPQSSERRRSPPISSDIAAVIDLSESQTQTPEVQPLQIERNNDPDDDVILVSPDIHPVVDLCTPSGHQEAPRRRTSTNYRELNRRRLSHEVVDNGETCYEGPSSTRRRHANYFMLQKSNSEAKKPTNSNENSSSTTAASDRTPNMCPVCMESYLHRLPTSTRCGHVFCKNCIEHAIRLTRKCPMCNTKISHGQIFRIYL